MANHSAPPPALVADIAAGRCLLFAGSGLSKHARELPLWAQFGKLIRDAIPHTPEDAATDENVAKHLLEYLEFAKTHHAAQYEAAVRRILSSGVAQPTQTHALLTRLPWKAVITTNLDTLLEDAFVKSERVCNVVRDEDDIAKLPHSKGMLLLKMHGSVDSSSRVLTFGEYQEFDQQRHAMKALLLSYLARYPTIIIGAGLTDPNFLRLCGIVHASFKGFHQPAYYVGSGVPGFVRTMWQARKFQFVDVPHEDLSTFLEDLTVRVKQVQQSHAESRGSFSLTKHLKAKRLSELGDQLDDYGELQTVYTDNVQMPDYGWFREQWDRTLYEPLRESARDAIHKVWDEHGQKKVRFLYCAPGPHAPAMMMDSRGQSFSNLLSSVTIADIDAYVLRAAREAIVRANPQLDAGSLAEVATDFTGGLGADFCSQLATAVRGPDSFQGVQTAVMSCMKSLRAALTGRLTETALRSAAELQSVGHFDVAYSEMVAAFAGTAMLMALRSALYCRFRDPSHDKGLEELLTAATALWREFNEHVFSMHVDALSRVTSSGGRVVVVVDVQKVFDAESDPIDSFNTGPQREGYKHLRHESTREITWRDHAFGLNLDIAGRPIRDFAPHKHRVEVYTFKRLPTTTVPPRPGHI